MANTYDKVLNVISKRPEQRQDFEIQGLLQWLRKKSKLFATLKTDYLKDIGRNCGLRTYQRDDIIIKQGEIGDCFYIILGGKISIYIINKDRDGGGDGDERSAYAAIGNLNSEGRLDRSKLGNFVTSLGSGFPFGEVALVSDDAIRTASIIAEEDNTDLLVVDRALYNRAVRDVLAAEFDEKQDFIKTNELFKTWIPKYKKQLTMAMYKETFPYDSVLVKQGDCVGNIYFIISGQVEITTDPTFHPVQYPKLYKLLEDEREKLIKEKKHKKPQDLNENLPCPLKKRDSSKTVKMCYLGKNETLGEVEVLVDMETYMTTAVCKEKTEVLVLEMKHYERLFAKKHQRTIDAMRRNLEVKLNTRSSILKDRDEIPLLKLIQLKLHMVHNPPPVQNEKKKKSGTSVQNAEKMFFNHQGPLLDMDGPGSVFYMIRAREKSRLLLKAHQKERNKTRQSQQKGHIHSIRLPQSLVMAAQIAGATENKVEKEEENETVKTIGSTATPQTENVNEIDVVAEQNVPHLFENGAELKRIQSARIRSSQNESAQDAKSVRRIQSAAKPGHYRVPDNSSATYTGAEYHIKSQSASRPVTRFEHRNVDESLRKLEEKVKEWLRRDDPKRGANVAKLRRLQAEELEPRPKPGNKIVIRKRSKGSQSSGTSTFTGASVSSTSTNRSVDRISRFSKSETNSLDRFKILLAN